MTIILERYMVSAGIATRALATREVDKNKAVMYTEKASLHHIPCLLMSSCLCHPYYIYLAVLIQI